MRRLAQSHCDIVTQGCDRGHAHEQQRVATRHHPAFMAEDSPAPRRSQRERKLAQHFTSGMLCVWFAWVCLIKSTVDSALSKGKRKRDDSDTEDEGSHERDVHASEEEGDDEDDEPDPKSKRKPRRSKTKSPVKPKGPPPAKKPRAAKQSAPKSDKPVTRRGRKSKNATAGAFNAAEVAKDTKISDDNPLFSASSIRVKPVD